jgi:hypothetical protein
MRKAGVAAIVLAGLGCFAAAPPASAQEETVWLCAPQIESNPCYESLETTVHSPEGDSRVENPPLERRPKIDCFYVYPTVSEQPSANSDRSIEEQQTAIARYQAARFSQRCRVYAPMYRQRTLAAIQYPPEQQAQALRVAYEDIRAAWNDYLANHNRGRGFVLIGHSQGTTMLRQLVRMEIDPRAAVRRRMVSAILLGANVTVRRGDVAGGDFQHVPTCTRPRQTGCVIAYSAFNEPPPSNSRFGRPVAGRDGNPFEFPTGPDYEVVCANPAALRGGTAPLATYQRSEPFPGVIGVLLVQMYGGPPPSAPTPWVQPQDHYTGRCVNENDATVLMIEPIGSARKLNPSPDASWGLHLADVNIALGNLVDVVGSQERAYLKRAKRKRWHRRGTRYR